MRLAHEHLILDAPSGLPPPCVPTSDGPLPPSDWLRMLSALDSKITPISALQVLRGFWL
ncbi:hypothetical protein PYCCODRAFT_1441084 [Trametes coccinea BRFM310]|uniref:Uncharacterized protein n=1 Tax=Trametes coccinea (strain BRFM310) TaxID=1353009 RepID=A0A1Y2I7M3_TRAC3|nr:hypothetical protein PYCCODRAFT_1441084 [Trametes coccinea BRFM310]